MKWNIICDSSCDIFELKHLADDTLFSVAPLKIRFGDKEFVDDKDLDVQALRREMKSYKGASSSACPAPFDWMNEFEKADNCIAICITGALSGSYNSALTAKDMALEKWPDKKIFVLNSRATSGKMALLAIMANTLIKAGKSFEEIVNELEKKNNELQLMFCLKNYGNLIRTGRMSPFTGAVATALGIRAVAIASPEGEIQVLNKRRGDANAYKFFMQHMPTLRNLKDSHIVISHCDNPEGAKRLKELLAEQHGATNVAIIETRGLCSYYADEGGILIAF